MRAKIQTIASTVTTPASSETGSLSAMLHAAARKYPDNTAIEISGEQITYRQLDSLSSHWAKQVSQSSSPVRIGILGEKSFETYAAVWTALKLGVTYVPLNIKLPFERLTQQIQNAGVNVLLVDKAGMEITGKLQSVCTTELKIFSEDYKTCTSEPNSEDVVHENISAAQGSHDSVYILFTSGSTGKPKGVPISKSNLDSFLQFAQHKFNVGPEVRLSQTFDLSFDLSMFDMFMAWKNGACLCPLSSVDLLNPADFIVENRITVWFSVPSVAMLMMKRGRNDNAKMPSLRLSLFCGEALPVKIVEYWKNIAPDSRVVNLYGPTELTIACSYFECAENYLSFASANSIVPLGQIFDGHSFVVLGVDGAKVKEAETGELCVSGPQRFSGYLDSTFNTKAFVRIDGNIFYRTGDLVRQTEHGFEFMGRNDRQMKIRGHRIEPAEIENAIRGCEGVIFAVVKQDTNGDLCAFVFGRYLKKSLVHEHLAGLLPRYMVPKSINIIQKLTTNANGKVKIEANPMRYKSEYSRRNPQADSTLSQN